MILASLMVARDYVLSLPAAGQPDPVTDDLRAMVETVGLIDIERLEFGGNAADG